MDMEKLEYDNKYGNVKWDWVDNLKPGKLQTLKQKQCGYKIRGTNGKPMAGTGNLEYLEAKYKEPQKVKTFDFTKYSNETITTTEDNASNTKKFDLKNINFIDEKNEFDPVQTDVTDSKYLFDNQDAIVVNLKKKNK